VAKDTSCNTGPGIWIHGGHAVAILVMLLVFIGCAHARPRHTPSSTTQASTDTKAEQETIILATWNLDWLNETGEPSIQGAPKRTDDDYEALRRYGEKLHAHVIAFQEVSSIAAIKRIFPGSQYDFVIGTHGNLQKVGFAIKKGLPRTINAEYEALDVNGKLRSGVDLTVFPNGHPLRLLVVHLKSRCPDEPLNTGGPHCPSLAQQVPILEQWIDDRAAETVPFIVLGDFNRHFSGGEEFWTEIDDGKPRNADLDRTGKGQSPACHHNQHPAFVDYFVTDLRATNLVIQNSFQEWLYTDEDLDKHGDGLSDHCPLTVKVRLR
jgi:hypothetical protein